MAAIDQPLPPPEPGFDGLQWPAPVAEGDILWLEDAGIGSSHRPVDTVTLSHLLTLSGTLEWHESVAVVLGIADALPDGAIGLPPPDSILLEPEGHFHIAHGSGVSAASIVSAFGVLLRRLLADKPLPVNLRLFASVLGSDASAGMTLDQFLAEVARWERPGRQQKLADLYARVSKIDRPPVLASHEPVPQAPRVEPSVEQPKAPPTVALPATTIIVVAAIAASLVTGLATWFALRPAAAPPSAVAPQSAAAPVADRPVVESALTPAAPVPGVAAAGDITLPAAPQQPPAPAHKPVRAPRRAVAGSSRPVATEAVSRLSDARPATRPSVEYVPPKPAGIVAPRATPIEPLQPLLAPVEPVDRLFRSGEPGVKDAVLVRPHLPPHQRPDTPESALGFLELVVDTNGAVESVHLSSPANRYREKWWLFAAKDWQFAPATKDGRAVRFLKRIPLTDLNMSEPQ